MIPLRRAGSALAAMAVALSAGAASATASGEHHASHKPLDSSSITLDTLAPATIPAKGALVLSGRVHNGSDQTWHHVEVTPATSFNPLQSSAAVDAAAGFDPAAVVLGSPLPSLRVALPDLAPGASAPFTITIPRKRLSISGQPGVYWLGVTPASDEPHPPTLTARTFLPLLPTLNKKAQVNIALVVPLRESPLRTPTGTLAYAKAFTALLQQRGRLGRVARFGQRAAGRALTWIVDPALLDLVADDAAGSSAYVVGPAGTSPTGATPSPSPSPNPSGRATPSGSPRPTAAQQAQLVARSWLAAVQLLLRSAATYALPYGDPDVGTLVASGHDDLVTRAITLSAQSAAARRLSAAPAIAPVDGDLSQSEWAAIPAGETAFTSNRSVVAPHTITSAGARTVVIASPTSAGGPGPGDATSALNIRQRILADASMSAASPTPTSLTVVLPPHWDPGTDAAIDSFFPQLSRSWITFTSLAAPSSGAVNLAHVNAPSTGGQLANVRAAVRLKAVEDKLLSLLGPSNAASQTLARQLGATEMSTMSYEAARTTAVYRESALGTISFLDHLMGNVSVEGTPFVTLSGSSGVITVTLHNGLNVPIRIGLRQAVAEGNTFQVNPVSPISLDPGERSTLRIHVSAPRVGVQEVTLQAVTTAGIAVGTPLTFTLRSSPVGAVVWAILIAIGLVLAVVVVRRVRGRSAKQSGA